MSLVPVLKVLKRIGNYKYHVQELHFLHTVYLCVRSCMMLE
jgi:hypothetical protein